MKMPDFEFENTLNCPVAGIDEAGRGPWAGPVVAGAVVFADRYLPLSLLDGLDDSKKLTVKKREILYQQLFEAKEKGLLSIGIGEASAREIDELNILQATFLAMKRAFLALPQKPEWALIDGNRLPREFPCRTQAVIKGDGKSLSIAAASVVAKVYRDHLMARLAEKYPYYGFEKNAGYGTAAHIAALAEYGITPEHRLSYRPIRELLQKNAA